MELVVPVMQCCRQSWHNACRWTIAATDLCSFLQHSTKVEKLKKKRSRRRQKEKEERERERERERKKARALGEGGKSRLLPAQVVSSWRSQRNTTWHTTGHYWPPKNRQITTEADTDRQKGAKVELQCCCFCFGAGWQMKRREETKLRSVRENGDDDDDDRYQKGWRRGRSSDIDNK